MLLHSVVSIIQSMCFRKKTVIKPSVRCDVSSARNIDYIDTDNNFPPGTNDSLPKFGSYCIKASVDLVEIKNDAVVYEITGYDNNLDIQAKVNQVCRAYTTNDNSVACKNEKLVFLGPKEKCNGNITVVDVLNDHTFFF